jgi:LAO/AO transport system kinase
VTPEKVTAGDRRALAKAITLVESTRPEHRVDATKLLNALLPSTGGAVRVGISGPPGVGKSTLLEVLGLHLLDAGHRVAVLAVDPTSPRSGGSILGDKTRMAELARRPEAFVRPSPSGGDLGGVARRTNEVVLLCEAAGFDVVFVETVGVGQSEIAVADLVDTFVLLVAAGAGDELQGVKRGIMELADIVAVTKADGDFAAAARRAEADYRHAAQFLRRRHPAWEPVVLATSATTGAGVASLWDAVVAHRNALEASAALPRLRADQRDRWLDREVRDAAFTVLLQHPGLTDVVAELRDAVRDGVVVPSAAGPRLLDALTRATGS